MDEKQIKLQRFGRYLIFDHLVDGGMAKICRARFLGEQADKIVAIKMIQTQYSSDPAFKKMFMDEIKVAFGLIHPNIAQTYDYGILNGQLYTAMEYVDGKNVKQFLDRLKDRRYVFPVEISTFITAQVCQGLTYAHNFNDKLTGKTLNIIHRDISPHNIMITYDGAVKIIDFGIAKAETNSEETKAGTIKGKLSYLAPEYLEGMDLDHRYDQFAVGITLWELLCSRKLFQAANELAILKKIQECKVPVPSSINPNVPKELDQIVLKALSKDRNVRFQNMDQFNRALVKFLYSNYPDFNATDLNYFSKELFKEDIKDDREKLFIYGKIDLTPYLADLKNEMDGNGPTADGQGAKAEKVDKVVEEDRPRDRAVVLDLGMEESEMGGKTGVKAGPLSLDMDNSINKVGRNNIIKSNTKSSAPAQRPANRPAQAGPNQTRQATASHRPSGKAENDEVRKGTTIFKLDDHALDNKDKNQAGGKKNYIAIGGGIAALLAIILVKSFVFDSSLKAKLFGKDSSDANRDPSSVSEESEANKIVTRKVILTNVNPFQQYYVNDKEVKFSVTGIDLPVDKTVMLRIEQENKKPIFLNIEVTKTTPTTIKVPDPSSGNFGILKSSADYTPDSTLSTNVEGNHVVYQLPIMELRLPVGKYNGEVKNGESGLVKEVNFEIIENTITRLPK